MAEAVFYDNDGVPITGDALDGILEAISDPWCDSCDNAQTDCTCPPASLPALTIWQPYASLAAHGHKTIETRPAPPAGDMRPEGVRPFPGVRLNRGDRVAIHAAAKVPPPVMRRLGVGGWRIHPYTPDGGWLADRDEVSIPLPFGAIVGTAVIADCVPILGHDGQRPEGAHSAIWEYEHEGDLPHQQGGLWMIGLAEGAPRRIEDQRDLGDFRPGRWAWLLADAKPCDPIPAKGREGVWRWTPGDDRG